MLSGDGGGIHSRHGLSKTIVSIIQTLSEIGSLPIDWLDCVEHGIKEHGIKHGIILYN